jgi:hypothetical protein
MQYIWLIAVFFLAGYTLFDPVITCANVLGEGAFAKMMDKVLMLLGRRAGRVA